MMEANEVKVARQAVLAYDEEAQVWPPGGGKLWRIAVRDGKRGWKELGWGFDVGPAWIDAASRLPSAPIREEEAGKAMEGVIEHPKWIAFDCPNCGAKSGSLCEDGSSCMARVLLVAPSAPTLEFAGDVDTDIGHSTEELAAIGKAWFKNAEPEEGAGRWTDEAMRLLDLWVRGFRPDETRELVEKYRDLPENIGRDIFDANPAYTDEQLLEGAGEKLPELDKQYLESCRQWLSEHTGSLSGWNRVPESEDQKFQLDCRERQLLTALTERNAALKENEQLALRAGREQAFKIIAESERNAAVSRAENAEAELAERDEDRARLRGLIQFLHSQGVEDEDHDMRWNFCLSRHHASLESALECWQKSELAQAERIALKGGK